MQFKEEQVIRFSPIYGISWFELVEYDGDENIVLGSFAYDFSPVPEPLLKQWKQRNVDLMVLENNLK